MKYFQKLFRVCVHRNCSHFCAPLDSRNFFRTSVFSLYEVLWAFSAPSCVPAGETWVLVCASVLSFVDITRSRIGAHLVGIVQLRGPVLWRCPFLELPYQLSGPLDIRST